MILRNCKGGKLSLVSGIVLHLARLKWRSYCGRVRNFSPEKQPNIEIARRKGNCWSKFLRKIIEIEKQCFFSLQENLSFNAFGSTLCQCCGKGDEMIEHVLLEFHALTRCRWAIQAQSWSMFEDIMYGFIFEMCGLFPLWNPLFLCLEAPKSKEVTLRWNFNQVQNRNFLTSLECPGIQSIDSLLYLPSALSFFRQFWTKAREWFGDTRIRDCFGVSCYQLGSHMWKLYLQLQPILNFNWSKL